MVRKLKSFIFLFFVFLFSFSVFAEVEIFTQYDTTIIINDDYTLDISKEILLRNVHDVGIVPGEVEFQIVSAFDGNGGEIIDFSVKDRYGNPIKSNIQRTAESSVILLNIFTPILPGFEYKINLDYTIQYESSGIFFKSLQFPLKEATKIPIKKGVVSVVIPDKYYITYLDYEGDDAVVEGNTISFDIDKDSPEFVSVEYSYIPVGFTNVRGSIVFWLTVNLLLIAVLFVQILKEVRKLKSSK